MDAAARAELEALRRRAYDRDADIAGDDVALERLSELEALALAARSVEAPRPSWTSSAPEPKASTPDPSTQDPSTRGGPASEAVPPADGSTSGRPAPRRFLVPGMVASVALLVAVLGLVHGLQTTRDPISPGAATAPSPTRSAGVDLPVNGRATIPLLVNRVRGEFVDVSWRADGPTFPVGGVTKWAHPLGVYDGWALWVGRVSSRLGPQNCLLLTDGAETEARCHPLGATAERPVGVSLDFDELGEDQRPPGMAPDQRLTFEWGGGAYLTMEITDS